MKKPSIITQIIFSPLTIWLAIGTIFLLVLYKFELSIKSIGIETKSHFFKYDFKSIEYHKISFWATFFFFIIFPFLLVKDIALFIGVMFIYIYEYVVNTVEELYNKVVQEVQLLWERIVKSIK
jgi:hypothetical protein